VKSAGTEGEVSDLMRDGPSDRETYVEHGLGLNHRVETEVEHALRKGVVQCDDL
jgi:hypothetical protein